MESSPHHSRTPLLRVSGLILISLALAGLTAFAPPQSADESTLREQAERYYTALFKRDLEGVLALWSVRSPHHASYKANFTKVIAGYEGGKLEAVTVRRWQVEGENARVSVRLALRAAATGPGTPSTQSLFRRLECVREPEGWKVWKEISETEELAAALLAAERAERERLLRAERELITVELERAVREQARQWRQEQDYLRALDAFLLALSLAEQIDGQTRESAALLHTIGNLHDLLGNYTSSLACYARSLKIYESLGDAGRVARVLGDTSVAYMYQGRYREALNTAQQALARFEALQDQRSVAFTLNNIGEMYRWQSNVAQATAYYEKSLALKEFLPDGGAGVLNNLGVLQTAQGNYARALEYYQQSLAMKEARGDKRRAIRTLANIANVHGYQGNNARAVELLQKALEQLEPLGDRASSAVVQDNLADLLNNMGDHARALDFALRAAALAEQTGSRDVLWKCRYRAGQAYAGLRRFTEARRAFEASIAVIEGLRDDMAGGEAEREQFFESRVGPYRALAELLITLNQKEDAFLAAERAKARVLLDVLQSGQRSVTKAMTPEEQGKETRLQSELAALRTQMYREKLRAQPDPTRLTDLNARLQQARTQWEAFRTQLYAAHPRLKALRGESAPLTWKEVRQSLPHPKSVVLEFLVTEDTTFLFVLTREGLRLHAIAVPRKTLSRRIDQFRQQLARRDLGFRAAALALYNLLLKPAQEQLKDKTTLILIPDGVLWELPFQALQPVPTRYLLQEFALCYAPSLSALREMSRSRPAASSLPPGPLLLAVGNPALVSTSPVSSLRDITLAPLPETEKEVAALRQLYSGPNSRIYIGAQAQERRVKAEAGGVHVLHLATHGILDDRRPLYSCLVLSQDSAGSGEDGLLEAWEIMALDLHADLTVLSGCETARGGVRTGEGVIGLTWALFVAGCRTAVVSQWKVEAASTTRLMVAFHQRLRSAPAVGQPATALRLAALQLMKDSRYRHPFYWAGFIVIGRGL